MDARYRPFESLNECGDIVGLDIDLMTVIADRAGIDVKLVNTPWTSLPEAVARGDAEILISAMSIAAERREQVGRRFVRPGMHPCCAQKKKPANCLAGCKVLG